MSILSDVRREGRSHPALRGVRHGGLQNHLSGMQSVLRPAKPVPPGKTVKCPECGNRFTASEENRRSPLRKPKKAGHRGGRRAQAEEAGRRKASPKRPAAKSRQADRVAEGDDDEEGGTYGFVDPVETEDKPDIEYAPDMSIKDLRGPAQSALVRPTNMMILVGGLGFLVGWRLLLLILIPALTPIERTRRQVQTIQAGDRAGTRPGGHPRRKRPAGGDEKRPQPEVHARNLRRQHRGVRPLDAVPGPLALPPIFVGMVYCGFLTFGAVKVQNLEGHGWGIASCVMLMIPLLNSFGFMASTGLLIKFVVGMVSDDPRFVYQCVISLMSLETLAAIGVGVWGLTTLLSEKVVKGFEYKAE